MTAASSPVHRPRNAAETKKRLLEAAEAEFAAKGFDGARLGNIARATGVQQALIHHYFGDKAGIYRAVVERGFEAITTEGWDILSRMDASIHTLVEAFVDALLRFFASHRALLSILRHEAESGGELAQGLIAKDTKPVFDAVVAELERRAAAGALRRDFDPRQVCVSAVAMCSFPYTEEMFLQAVWPTDVRAPEFIARRKSEVVATVMARIAR
jgi:AcrR family transcriptional regulator